MTSTRCCSPVERRSLARVDPGTTSLIFKRTPTTAATHQQCQRTGYGWLTRTRSRFPAVALALDPSQTPPAETLSVPGPSATRRRLTLRYVSHTIEHMLGSGWVQVDLIWGMAATAIYLFYIDDVAGGFMTFVLVTVPVPHPPPPKK